MAKDKEPKEKKAKPPKEKKPKKEKPPKEKKAKKGKKEKEPKGKGGKGGKKKNPIKMLLPLVVIIAAAVIVFTTVLGKKTEEEPTGPQLPEEYLVGEVSVPAMAVAEEEDAVQADKHKTVVYTYSGLKDAGSAAEGYVGQLVGATPRFSVVDEEFVRTDRPDFTAPEGMVLLARDLPVEAPPAASAAPEGEDGEAQPSAEPLPEPTPMVLTVRVEWSEGTCVITADEAEGTVTSPPTPPRPSGGGGMGQRDAQDYVAGMSTEKLGLPGASMEEYEVMAMDGIVMVNGVGCTRVNVYQSVASGSNNFMGSYLVSLDGQHVYRVDPVTNEITVIE